MIEEKLREADDNHGILVKGLIQLNPHYVSVSVQGSDKVLLIQGTTYPICGIHGSFRVQSETFRFDSPEGFDFRIMARKSPSKGLLEIEYDNTRLQSSFADQIDSLSIVVDFIIKPGPIPDFLSLALSYSRANCNEVLFEFFGEKNVQTLIRNFSIN